MRDYYVYILTNKSRDVLYIGVTNDVAKRLWQHGESTSSAFARRYNLTLVVPVEQFRDPVQAIAREKQLKGWRRSKKIALITKANPHWDDLAGDFF